MYFCFFIIGFFLSIQLSAQNNMTMILQNSDNKIIGTLGDVKGVIITTFRPNDIKGIPYLGEEWNRGSVSFKNGKVVDSLLLQFDLVTNLLYFKQEGVMQTFMEEVTSFRFYEIPCADQKNMIFRSDYPSYGQQRQNNFYQVLEEGPKYHLLCYRAGKINETYVYGGLPKRSYATLDVLFLYNVKTGEINKLTLSKKAILKLLPSFADTIESLCRKNNWQLKSESEIKELIRELNSADQKIN